MPLHDVGYRPWPAERPATVAQPGPRAGGTVAAAVKDAVAYGLANRDLGGLTHIGIDEISRKRGHVYVTNVYDLVTKRLIWSGEGRSEDTLRTFFDFLGSERIANLQGICCDMWKPYIDVIKERAPQAVLLAVVVGLVAPRLIAGDLRAKAWLVYFTRPISRGDYILGKVGVLAAIVSLITLVPALVLWAVGVLVSPSVQVAVATWDLPLRILAAAAAVTIPTVLLALAYSSLTAESRIAAFAWFATWVACWIAHGALTGADLAAQARSPAAAAALDDPARAAGIDGTEDRWAWVSLFHAQGVVQAWIFGIEQRMAAVWPSLACLTAVASGSLAVLLLRVDAPARA